MKTIAATAVVAALAGARPALAAAAATPEGSGLLALLFLALGAVIVTAQLIPALTLFASLVSSLFADAPTGRAGAAGEGAAEAR